MERKQRPSETVKNRKIFVLDTSVILYDHNALHNFKEHDVAIPIQVLEELDNMKTGNETRNLEARSFIRIIDHLSKSKLISEWVPIKGDQKGKFKVVLSAVPLSHNAIEIFGDDKFDHHIINAALTLMDQHPGRKVILVSKDICLRLKAQSLNLYAEDYQTGKVTNIEELYSGKLERKDFPEALFKQLKNKQSVPLADVDIEVNHPAANHFYIVKHKRQTTLAFFSKDHQSLRPVTMEPVFGIKPRNPEQAFALDALLNPDIKDIPRPSQRIGAA